ncbi:hypothetical protein [Pseudanabaena sp. PCC 6802]|uniref:hypothetical protein n=1 Tax=Pseudanabaena sp. PCC 6802 TaxID=118173 RepID=UPI000344BF04|nr:hypothetical protein [Pseudanabaena sp. PCC 6802]
MVWALLTESLERRFDSAFGVIRTEQELNEQLSQRVLQLEAILTQLGEAFALDDDIRRERDYLESLLRQQGIDPWGLPQGEEE